MSATSQRKYEETHPWITFRVDFRDVAWTDWRLLGQAEARIDALVGIPLQPSVADFLHQIYLAKGVVATTAIEGNTLTEEQVQTQLRGNLRLPSSQKYLAQETQNIIDASNWIAQHPDAPLTPDWICRANGLVLKGVPVSDEVLPGALRTHGVHVGNYPGAPAVDVPYLVDRLCEWLNSEECAPLDAPYAVMKAILAHLYVEWIHPFGDGNGRTGRLLEFSILYRSGVPSIAAHLLSNHYNLTRAEYYRRLDAARRKPYGVLEFVQYALQGFADQLQQQLGLVRGYQQQLAWQNYVFGKLAGRSTEIGNRQRELVAALTVRKAPVPIREIDSLNVPLAKAYAGKTGKTITRDLKDLEALGIVQRVGRKKVRACPEVILAFLPAQHSPPGAQES